ncbi:class I SAM-dependent methyltransferase [Nitrosophilus alvini]|uniref:class I SAM-dependent methyltransferase n=1 Tax=Nitrosophilus alvini TaxID=2714855 RepID=UPI00190DE28F|nr:class I SAM-dependent methyltransferase [Nitrosophilus alvini]
MAFFKSVSKKERLYSKSQQILAEEISKRLRLKGDENVLDIGSGNGKITYLIALKTPTGSVLGIDIDKEAVESAKKLFYSEKNLEFRQMDVKNIQTKLKFDAVYSNAVFHWIDDHFTAVKNISEVMKENGRLYITMGAKGNAKEIFETMQEVIQTGYKEQFADFVSPYNYASAVEFEEILKRNALFPKRVGYMEKKINFGSKEMFKGWISTAFRSFVEKSGKNREKFLEDFVELFLKKYPQKDGSDISVNMKRLEIEAFKNSKKQF